MATVISQLNATNKELDFLRSEFSGLDKLESIIRKTLERLQTTSEVQAGWALHANGPWSLQTFDGWFAPIVRSELGKTLAIVRAKAKQKAAAAGAGSAASGVTWHQTQKGDRGYVGITSPGKRLSSRTRIVPPPNGGASGIRRNRSVSGRTEQIRGYYGPDRHFILRFLEFGTDVRTAKPAGPTGRGSMATYGVRGSIAPRNFFHTVQTDMEQAAQQLGETLIGHVENWVETQFTEE